MSIPLTKDNNKDYEHIKVDQEKMKERGIKGYIRDGGWTFESGELRRRGNKKGLWDDRSSNVIPGLRCPDCSSCAHYTDVPNVATCCTPIGWFFFYRRLDQDVSAKTKLVIKNGEIVESTDADKENASF